MCNKKNEPKKSFLEALTELLGKNGVTQDVIAKYSAEDPEMWQRISELFMRLSEFANEKRKQEMEK